MCECVGTKGPSGQANNIHECAMVAGLRAIIECSRQSVPNRTMVQVALREKETLLLDTFRLGRWRLLSEMSHRAFYLGAAPS